MPLAYKEFFARFGDLELLDSIVGQRGKSLNFFTNDVVLLLEYDGNYN